MEQDTGARKDAEEPGRTDLEGRLEAAHAALGRAMAGQEPATVRQVLTDREREGEAEQRAAEWSPFAKAQDADGRQEPVKESSGPASGKPRKGRLVLGVWALGAAVAVVAVLATVTVVYSAPDASRHGSGSGDYADSAGPGSPTARLPNGSVPASSIPVTATGTTPASGTGTRQPSGSPGASQSPDAESAAEASVATSTAPPDAPAGSPDAASPGPMPMQAASGHALAAQASGKCLSSTSGNDARATVATCDGSAAQTWTFASDGTLRSAGLCLTVSGGKTADHTPIKLTSCDGSGPQLFSLTDSGTLLAESSRKCVNVLGGGTGTKTVLLTCNGREDQQWSLA